MLAAVFQQKRSKALSHFSKRESGALTSAAAEQSGSSPRAMYGGKANFNCDRFLWGKTSSKPREIFLLEGTAASCKQNLWKSVRVMPEKGREKGNPLNEQQEQPKCSCWTPLLARAVLPLEFPASQLSPHCRDRNDFVFSLRDGEFLALFRAQH